MRRAALKVVQPTHKPDDAQAAKRRALAAFLNRTLVERGWKQADLARLVFGSTTDREGFNRARGADAISAYCQGRQLPEANRLAKLAEVCGTTVENMTGASDQPAGIHFRPTDGQRGRLTVDMECDLATYARIVALIARAK